MLEEGVALRAADIDVIYLTGYGFPAFRGGPMFYADRRGLRTCIERVSDVPREHGDALGSRRRCSSGWPREGSTFRELDAARVN